MQTTEIPEHYFENDNLWQDWLHKNHAISQGVYLIFYKVASDKVSMRWEEAVKVALCYGWIDSTVKSLGNDKRRQYFCKRKPKSVWSKLNKNYIKELTSNGALHQSGKRSISIAKENGSWIALDDVENGVIPKDLQQAFTKETTAFENYKNFAPSYRKNYLYWLNMAKRAETREKRINEIIQLCNANTKQRQNGR